MVTRWVFFSSNRGLRQGDHVSPYLFVIGMEYFSRMLNQLRHKEGFQFHLNCRRLNLTHISFADDMMAFYYGNFSSASIVKDSIDAFANTSGLYVNP